MSVPAGRVANSGTSGDGGGTNSCRDSSIGSSGSISMDMSKRLVSIDSKSTNSGGGLNSAWSTGSLSSMDESSSLNPGGGERMREKDSSLLKTKFSESWRLEQDR